MANTANYDWPLPSPRGNQMEEVAKIATSLIAIDAKLKSAETALSTHKHKFADLLERPTTLGGYGITDGMTATEVAAAIQQAVSDLVNGSGAALDTLKELADALGNDPEFATTVSNALALRIRVDAAQSFSLAQKAQGRSNLDALGTVDKGKADGVASLDGTGKVPSSQLPEMNYLPSGGGRLKGTVKVQVGDSDGSATLVPGDDTHTGYMEGWLPNGKRGFYFGWAVPAGKVLLATENGLSGFEVTGSLQVNSGFASVGVGSQRGIFRNTGAGDSWINFHTRDQVWYSEFGQRANGAAYVWVNNKEYRFQTNGQFVSPGDVVASATVYAGGGSAYFGADGNMFGSRWGTWGYSTDAFLAIDHRIEKRAGEYADDRLSQARAYAEDRSFWRTQDFLISRGVDELGMLSLVAHFGGGSPGRGAVWSGNDLGPCVLTRRNGGALNILRPTVFGFGSWRLSGGSVNATTGNDEFAMTAYRVA